MIQSLKKSRVYQHVLKIGDFFPALFFFVGFIWDAKTFGGDVTTVDLLILTFYLFISAVILYSMSQYYAGELESRPQWLKNALSSNWPYLILQFLFGTLLNVLVVLYFKSASHLLAWLMIFLLAVLLVASEHYKDEFRNFTLSWALFGFCSMLLFNFLLPFLLGSINPVWFYISTLLGTGFAYGLYAKTPNHLGSIKPIWIISLLLMFAYAFDVIPPVPLVKREIAMAYDVQKLGTQYQLSQQASKWWVFWRKTSDDLTVAPNQRVYCFSSIFAPAGLSTKLYHNWQIYTKKGWVTQSRAGFALNGGRDGGYRVYTFKSNITAGDWRVSIETENGKTLAIHPFTVEVAQSSLAKPIEKIVLNY